MKLLSYLGRKSQIYLTIACGTLPIAVLVYAYTAPGALWLSLLIPLCYFLLSCVQTLVPGKIRWLYILFGLGVFGGLGTFLFRLSGTLAALIPVILYAGIFLCDFQIRRWEAAHSVPPGLYAGFILIHIAGQIIQAADRRAAGSILGGTSVVITAAFLVCSLFTMLAWNRASLSGAAFENQKASSIMARRNVFFVLFLFLMTGILSAIPGVVGILKLISGKIGGWFSKLTEFLFQKMPEGPGYQGQTQTGDQFMSVTPSKLSPFTELMIKITSFLAQILVIAAVVWLVYFLIRRMSKFFIKLIQKVSATDDCYEDEVSDTRFFDEQSEIRHTRRKKSPFDEPSKNLNPGEKIRLRYFKLMQKHGDWTRGRTARENLPREAAQLYERARYSDHPIDDADAELFKRHTTKI